MIPKDLKSSVGFSSVHAQDEILHPIDTHERDACALICAVRKGGQATHGNVKRTIESLARMGHRTGFINGEGDGVGILTDIPRQLWTKRLAQAGLRSSLVANRDFWVAHVMIPTAKRADAPQLVETICQRISEAGLHVLIDQPGMVNEQFLGPNAKRNQPVFWQIAGISGEVPQSSLDKTIFRLQTQLERELGIHFPSFSAHSVVYKIQGTVEILRRYYPELRDPDFASIVTLGHARYSTNTNPIFERAQPFGVLGHNGELNTISRFRLEAAMLGIELDPNNSDSQDVDRVAQALCMQYDLDLVEAMEYIFPPFEHDLLQNAREIHQLYEGIRQAFGPFAQGPAAIAARLREYCVFSVDALGLRPLWFGETEKEYFASSERGVYPLDMMSTEPKPMAPGEKIALRIKPGHSIEVLDYPAIQRHMLNRRRERLSAAFSPTSGLWSLRDLPHPGPANGASQPGNHAGFSSQQDQPAAAQAPVALAEVEADAEPVLWAAPRALPWLEWETRLNANTMAALGWERYHISIVETLAESAKEQIGSLGWDGPLAAISKTRVNLADYFKETVAVVTNPAIDRERENAQFSTRMIIGSRPEIMHSGSDEIQPVQIDIPLLVGGHPDLGALDDLRTAAEQHGTFTLEDLLGWFREQAVVLSTTATQDEGLEAAVQRLQQAAVDAALEGAQCIVLDDTQAWDGQRLWLDPVLVTAALDKALREYPAEPNLRRQVGIVVRSGALRDLHDLALCISMGANALVPYALYAVGLGIAPRASKDGPEPDQLVIRLNNMLKALRSGIEKIISTIGCHELRGYGQAFSSVGLSQGVARYFATPNYFGAPERGLTWERMAEDSHTRAAELRGELKNRLDNPDRFYPKMWKKAEAAAQGELSLEAYTQTLLELEAKQPVALRHILGLKKVAESPVDPAQVDIGIKGHRMPVLIGAMSFGSQGELAYKAYAEAAFRLNILCINGEGGELPDVMGRYPNNRGQQIASGRFGVNIEFLNSCNLLEIKIGQGAKPGEGGQLPGFKVSEQVARARKTTPGVALISPSNNHDLYSIEDLAQLIDELKTANPNARVSVKIPVVPGVGIIAVGVAKAGADIINITGYDGGTGAARAHSLRHVGLPAEIGVWLSHRALVESGLRDAVELWCDGGMKSGRDVIKMLCLGANRVGFGTLAMVAVGCTICRKCHDGTCHVGITTHIRTLEEAAEKGLKSFEPRDYDLAVEGICTVFEMLAEDIRDWTATLGFSRTQDLVGRADLLEQISMHEQIDLTLLTRRVVPHVEKRSQPGGRQLTRPRNTLSKQITSIVSEYVARGEYELTYDDEQVMAMDRALATHLAGALERGDFANADKVETIHLNFSNSATPGNGLAAFLSESIDVLVEGGAQDGVAKCAMGGTVTVLKGLNHNGQRLDGSVGKSFAYGAQGGLFIVQGNADTRACIRLSGADVIFGGEVQTPLQDELGCIGARANLKGYACEYMTAGRVLVLGDPGPWICAGMTGGVLYQRIQPEMNLTVEAIRRRIAQGAVVDIFQLNKQGIADVTKLLGIYIRTLQANYQSEAATHLVPLLMRPQDYFVKIAPVLH